MRGEWLTSGIPYAEILTPRKEYSIYDYPIRRPFSGNELIYPLKGKNTVPAELMVTPGQRVKVGEMLALGRDWNSLCVSASVSGTVKEIADCILEDGTSCPSVILKNDEAYTLFEGCEETVDPSKLTDTEILMKIRRAGIGGTPLLHQRLALDRLADKQWIVINATDAEPGLDVQTRGLMEEQEEFFAGLKIVMRLCPQAKAILALEETKFEETIALRNEAEDIENLEVQPVWATYPAGWDNLLAKQITGRRVRKEEYEKTMLFLLPSEVIAICRAVTRSMPVTEGMLSVSRGITRPYAYLRVKTGTKMREIFRFLRVDPEGMHCLLGGAMTGTMAEGLDFPVGKELQALLYLDPEELRTPKRQMSCIRCGRCEKVCPMGLHPSRLICKDKDFFLFLRGDLCRSCGCCTYVCPAKISLTEEIAERKKRICE